MIFFEVIATNTLKVSDEFIKIILIPIIIFKSGAAFNFMSLVLRTVPGCSTIETEHSVGSDYEAA